MPRFTFTKLWLRCGFFFGLLLLSVPMQAADPGLPIPADDTASELKAGSILVYNFYTSSATGGEQHNTRFTFTNLNPTSIAVVRLFFVASGGQVSDVFICFAPSQTAAFLASDVDPGITGYLIAVAVDQQTGCPVGFNHLTGEAQVKFLTGHSAGLKALAFSALFTGVMPGCNANAVTANLNFDGSGNGYNRVPSTLAIENFESTAPTLAPTPGNNTLLVVNRIGGDMRTGAQTTGALSGTIYDDAGGGVAFTLTGGVQVAGFLNDNFPRIPPLLSEFIPHGRTGWLKVSAFQNRGITGAVFKLRSTGFGGTVSFTAGHNLRTLETTMTPSVLTISVRPPVGC
jgi:hypothetical protein